MPAEPVNLDDFVGAEPLGQHRRDEDDVIGPLRGSEPKANRIGTSAFAATAFALSMRPDSVDLVTFLDAEAFMACELARNEGYFHQAAESLHPGGRLLILNSVEVAGEQAGQHDGVPTAEEMIAWVVLFERRPDV